MKPSKVQHAGRSEWLTMRVLAALMVPLAPWVALILAALPKIPAAASREWLLSPSHIFPLLGFLLVGSLHAALGLRTIVDDYVHGVLAKRLSIFVAASLTAGIFVIGVTSLLRTLKEIS